MFKTYMSKYYPSEFSEYDVAEELVDLPGRFVLMVDVNKHYYIWDGFKTFSVLDKDYVIPNGDLVAIEPNVSIYAKALKTTSLSRKAFRLGNRRVIPIYNFETGSIDLLGVNFTDLGGLVVVNDTGKDRVFSYGVRGSEFYFDEL